ncbi:MAG TPA: hypothetical protein VJA87_01245 [Candidatus Paceibacterota bacterium]
MSKYVAYLLAALCAIVFAYAAWKNFFVETKTTQESLTWFLLTIGSLLSALTFLGIGFKDDR